MRSNTLAAWLMAAALHVAAAISGGFAATAAGKDTAAQAGLGNAACLSCHDGRKGKLEVPAADGGKRALHAVAPEKFAKSVHSDMECIACHLEIHDSSTPHKKTLGENRPDCVQCHQKLGETAIREKAAGERRRFRLVAESIESYRSSYHARPNQDDATKANASCNDCHNVHSFNVPPRGSAARTDWHLGIPDLCGKCHTDQLKTWGKSAHGREMKQKQNAKSADCADCHSAHKVVNSSSNAFKLAVTAGCGNCHEDAYESYRATYHGQVTTLGFTYTAKCFDCHGSHDVEPSKSPKARMHPENRLESCQECHSGKKDVPLATAGFVSFSPHGNSHDFAAYPEIWLTTKFMIALLAGVFAFFWAHSILWWYREYADRKQGKNRWHIRTHELPKEELALVERRAEGPVQHVRRFGPAWRLAHLLFALSVMTLVLTGMSTFYAETGWAKAVMAAFGSPKTAGLVHRVAAFTMLGIFFLHLIAVSINIARKWKDFKIFGPDSFVPNWKDMYDIIGMFKWFVGKGPRPAIERWSYWEKFDYWAVFWGMAIIGGSGMMLAFPHVVAKFAPGWLFNIAAVVHGEEAFLAAVFLFTVHFFNNHFRPDKLPPPDVVMFTGTQSLDEFKHEHAAQYQRLVETGELEKYLVDAPSQPFTLASKILGLVLIACGLSMLVMIAIGFFGGGAH
jgi:cytochrome b subunit of formate dehydrogenase